MTPEELAVLHSLVRQIFVLTGRIKKRANAQASREKAKLNGTKFGRPRKGNYPRIRKLRDKGFSMRHIAKLENVSVGVVQNAINETQVE